jgi:hypothetical protein
MIRPVECEDEIFDRSVQHSTELAAGWALSPVASVMLSSVPFTDALCRHLRLLRVDPNHDQLEAVLQVVPMNSAPRWPETEIQHSN